MSDIKATSALIARDMELELPEQLTEAEFLQLLADRVAQLMEAQPGYVFSMLYRLDVDERKVEQAMHPGNEIPTNVGLARLILERQKQRLQTKANYTPPDIEGWDDF